MLIVIQGFKLHSLDPALGHKLLNLPTFLKTILRPWMLLMHHITPLWVSGSLPPEKQIPGQPKKLEQGDIGVLLIRHTDSDKAQTHSQETTMLNIILESLQAMIGLRKEQPLVPGSHGDCLFNSRSHSDHPQL